MPSKVGDLNIKILKSSAYSIDNMARPKMDLGATHGTLNIHSNILPTQWFQWFNSMLNGGLVDQLIKSGQLQQLAAS